MARKTRSRKTAKKRGGLRRRKTTTKRGGAGLLSDRKIIDVNSIADSNGKPVKLGDKVKIKGSMLTGTKFDHTYILFRIDQSNKIVTFVSIPARKPDPSLYSVMENRAENRVQVHVINMKYENMLLGYTVEKQDNNTISIITSDDNISKETTTFESNIFYDNYKDMQIDNTTEPHHIFVKIPLDKYPVTWADFEQKVGAKIVQGMKSDDGIKIVKERKVTFVNGERVIGEPYDVIPDTA